MFNLLLKVFIKNPKDTKDPKVRSMYGLLCSYISIFLNFILFIIKLIIGLILKSVSITADAFNNLSDSASSIINLIAFKFSLKPPDKEHPLGHGRYEYISSLIISFLIIFVGISFIKSSFEKILSKETTSFNWVLFFILIISIFIKIWIGFLNLKISKKINSQSLKATSVDALYDALITTVLSLSILLSNFTNLSLDGYAGIIISSFIIYSGIKLIKETLNPLLGEAPSEDFVQNLKSNILKHENILGLHDLIVHNYGPNRTLASIHAEVPSNLSLIDVHILIDKIEKQIEQDMGIHLVIHMDPIDIHNQESLEIFKNIKTLIKKNIYEVNNIVDFRILNTNGKNTIFFEIKLKNEFYDKVDFDNILKSSTDLINKNYPDFDCKIFKNNTFN
ncbi:cation diffusion facilitator family transporter [Candidatus Arthromitus sp. SFB-turkey]|uniref:cation diffusion facilitator family transporter n=1 Tax=Candidatus Arthromitus sp. SFB-turkey TaxID=1840217 RepID=UPI0007F37712|nr:cation diffusion facilitator family transporter [Candidatus Arthromitus sp. SFB-turkey]OAT89253.1 cation transporter [Candidatus Arthromitus sp. SFB-turkey]